MDVKHFNFATPLDCITYVDISCLKVTSSHLERLAVVCPNFSDSIYREMLSAFEIYRDFVPLLTHA